MKETDKRIKIDEKDRMILLELDTDATQGLKQIARKLRTTKEAISYRIRQLESRGIISNYIAVYHPGKLGITYFKMYIKFAHVTEEKRGEIVAFVKNRKNFSWLATSEGSYDLMIGMHFASLADFEKYREELFRKFDTFFQRSSFAVLTEGEVYSRQYIMEKPNAMGKSFLFCSPAKQEELDDKDISIVKELSLGARTPLTEIAKRTKMTPSIVRYRKNMLEKKGVIVGYKLLIDYRRLNHTLFKCLLKIQGADAKRFHDLRLYSRQHPNIIYWMKTLGEWDIELDIEVPSTEEFYRIANEIRSKFSGILQNFDVLLVTEDKAVSHGEISVT